MTRLLRTFSVAGMLLFLESHYSVAQQPIPPSLAVPPHVSSEVRVGNGPCLRLATAAAEDFTLIVTQSSKSPFFATIGAGRYDNNGVPIDSGLGIAGPIEEPIAPVAPSAPAAASDGKSVLVTWSRSNDVSARWGTIVPRDGPAGAPFLIFSRVRPTATMVWAGSRYLVFLESPEAGTIAVAISAQGIVLESFRLNRTSSVIAAASNGSDVLILVLDDIDNHMTLSSVLIDAADHVLVSNPVAVMPVPGSDETLVMQSADLKWRDGVYVAVWLVKHTRPGLPASDIEISRLSPGGIPLDVAVSQIGLPGMRISGRRLVVDPFADDNVRFEGIATSGSPGDLLLVWRRFTSPDFGLVGMRFAFDKGSGPIFPIALTDRAHPYTALNPALTPLPNGRVLVAYKRIDDTGPYFRIVQAPSLQRRAAGRF